MELMRERRTSTKQAVFLGAVIPLLLCAAVAAVTVGSTHVAWQVTLRIAGAKLFPLWLSINDVGFISTHANDPVAARALLEYLVSPDAQAIFQEAGFEPHK